jgi:2-oxoglutarate ferredoxin oxidoreductase subunit beta
VAQGAQLANPDLKVIAFTGDGAGYGEGLAHLLFAAKRNADITVVVHDNGVYALTTGQRSPTSAAGFKGPSTPRGNEEDPFNPLALMLEAGATFVAREFSARIAELAEVIAAAVEHDGFSLVEVLQPSVAFHNTYKEFGEAVTTLDTPAATLDEALAFARETERLPSGIIYRVDRPSHGTRLYGERNPVGEHPTRDDRLGQVRALLGA